MKYKSKKQIRLCFHIKSEVIQTKWKIPNFVQIDFAVHLQSNLKGICKDYFVS